MRVVALISGGKDSCYNMVQCVAAGHEIVALANLRPENKDELDSYMYQTVGHQGIELYAEAMGLPLFQQPTQGVALLQEQVYTPTPEDEVEDLFQLLKTVKDEIDVDAVAVGAILSDYQRIRVENVCARLGLVALAYLWRRDQGELLQEMIDCHIDAIVIKVAALGLDPSKHLGMTIADLQPHILKMKEKYGLNICGEGGEYETFTLDCPLFIKTIVIDEYETVIHSNDAVAPVGYLNFKDLRLVEKENVNPVSSMLERICNIPVKTWLDLISDLNEDVTEGKLVDRGEMDEDSVEEPPPLPFHPSSPSHGPESQSYLVEESCLESGLPSQVTWEDDPLPVVATSKCNELGWCWIAGLVGEGEDCVLATRQALRKLNTVATNQLLTIGDMVAVSLYVRDMRHYTAINSEYLKLFRGNNPPVRICVEAPLPPSTPVLLEVLGYRTSSQEGDEQSSQNHKRHTMHVQGVSHWAPANIGPYSQAVRVGDIIYVAGQIALVPGTMQLVEGGVRKQCQLALRHVGRIIKAMDPNTQLRDVVQGVCYVTHPSYIPEACREWEKRTNNAIVDYVVVPQLPRGALLEWHIWAHRHNNRFEYEETGCCINGFRVSIRRRWNYENNVSAVVCYVSTATSNSGTVMIEEGKEYFSPNQLSDESLSEVLCYTLSKLLHEAAPTTVCNLRIFCKVGKAPAPCQIQSVLSKAVDFNIVHSIIPVCHLHNAHTFLSICGVRHN
ncbi:Diphthine--ammonia ligase [Cryptotermes secundus]|uniref:Diphthine--ammonia ligase n=1 Tax=Cryptotermes secundus TaxID=105785 RepID=A0A2J7PL03_9NEOP|nr:diphthine--ammonia ligase isoform X1 [Cryptotermes secundus]XP_023723580.1 diphthine--ammonia ligase isoform X1 [Cryptotermes secundus]XP_033610917.1 diphthine--ammonia ligase isoform X1 [Cryptotermes secundus]PNF17010.1 Diphthine--ammonia ligase [Cryptotermes secundus]PNF17011.1 Diphthine--ammonia ligase [Cryptotermes secundus]PNF17013.1 Diphthine--ammonia ligase [Cryptotermes secundus]